MSSTLAHYSPEDVIVSIAGFLPIEGYLDGTFVSINKDNNLFAIKESSDGVVSRVANRSKTYTVSVTLMSTSETNKILTRLAMLDNSTLMLKFPLIIKDTLGSTLLFSTTSWIEALPATDFDSSVSARSWSFKCANATLMIGGNESDSSLVEDAINTIAGLAPNISTLF